MSGRRYGAVIALAAWACFGFAARVVLPQPQPSGRQDEFAAAHRRSLAADPQGVTLTIRFAKGRTRFRPGEIIRLDFEFASDEPRGYVASTAGSDRSGRIGIDLYHIDRTADAVDPLGDYFAGGAGVGGGITSHHPLEREPFRITRDLNEWLRLTKPGRYRLYVASNRVGHDPFANRKQPPLPAVTSNVLEFDVMARDERWEADELREAVSVLDATEGAPDFGEYGERRHAACRVLRFLDTAAAASEMVRRYRGEGRTCDQEYNFGLVSTPHRLFALREMEARLAAPDQPVSSGYLYTLTRLASFARAGAPLPSYPKSNAEQQQAWQTQARRHRDSADALRRGYVEALAAAIGRKQKSARAISLSTLIDNLIGEDGTRKDAARAKREESLAALLPGVFLDLPLQTQNTLLGYRWRRVGTLAMLPVLQRILQDSAPANDPTETRELADHALIRIYDLNPEEGRRLMLEEMRDTRARVGFAALGSLPDETLPELDDALAANLETSTGEVFSDDAADEEPGDEEASRGTAAGREAASRPERANNPELRALLVERYATAAILPRVGAVYKSAHPNDWACLPQAALLAYFLRVAPAEGRTMTNEALAARDTERSRCYSSVLATVAKFHMSRELEEVAVAALGDAAPEIVASAANMLGAHGSTEAEDALWKRLRRWHDENSSRAAELRDEEPRLPEDARPPLAAEVLIEEALVRAIAKSPAWLLDAERINRLRSLAVSEYTRRRIAEFASRDDRTIRLFFDLPGESGVRTSIRQYEMLSLTALKNKLLQFPPGTRFSSQLGDARREEAEHLFAGIKSFLEEHGMKFDAPPPRD